MHEDGESDARELQYVEAGRKIFERSGQSDVGDAGTDTRCDKVDVHADSDFAKGS